MKSRPWLTLFGLLASLVLVSAAAEGQDVSAELKKSAAVGPQHKLLAGLEGTWEVTIVAPIMPGEAEQKDRPPTTAKATKKMVLGGRFLQERTSGEVPGGPIEGLGLIGYDNLTERYTWMWADSLGRAIMSDVGVRDKASDPGRAH